MTGARARVIVLGLVLAAAGLSCSIDSRSDDFRCGNGQGQCDPGRDCVDGWCVIDPDEIDAGDGCPAVCSRCQNGTCIIECDGPGECTGAITCPGDMACDVRCEFAGSCGGDITCGNGRCTVTCSGTGTCDGDIDCNDACACTTSCSGTGACDGNSINCPGPAVCNEGGQCTDQPNQCDDC